jgi:antirestriction protein ArdC
MLWQFKPMHTKGPDGKPAYTTNGDPVMADIPLVRLYAVFNAEQVDGAPVVPELTADPDAPTLTPDATAEALMNAYLTRTGVRLKMGGSVASFAPGTDTIAMPPLAQFAGVSEYYGTLLHEAVHSTGTKDRCNREGITKFNGFGSGRYAFEELVAEMGGAMLVAQCGLDQPEVTENTIAYLAGWAERIKADRQALISAASACAKAVDYVNGTTYTA